MVNTIKILNWKPNYFNLYTVIVIQGSNIGRHFLQVTSRIINGFPGVYWNYITGRLLDNISVME